jgi:hypothetical protein
VEGAEQLVDFGLVVERMLELEDGRLDAVDVLVGFGDEALNVFQLVAVDDQGLGLVGLRFLRL